MIVALINNYKIMITKLGKVRLAIPRVLTQQAFRTQSQLQQNPQKVDISVFQKNIELKSKQGRMLASQVTSATPFDKFEKEQRYEIFVNKMAQLYRSEKRFQQKKRAAFGRMRTAMLTSQTPVKQVLSEYNKLTQRGFDCDVLANSLDHLHTTLHARGNKPKVFADYSIYEMDQSWRMEKVASDLKFALTSDNAFFSAANMGRISRKLGDVGYKNTELIQLWFQKLNSMLTQKKRQFVAGPTFEQAVFGSMKNFIPRHYIYQGYASNQEFQEHIDTLVHFRTTQQESEAQENVQEIEETMNKLIEAAKEMRELQVDQQAAIESLRDQFFKLQSAQNKHEFLKTNKYLMYDMLELQELLVKGGYIDPTEALLGQKDNQTTKMERASQIFYDLVLNYQPELLSPQYNAFYDASVASQTPSEKVRLRDEHNQLNIKSLSNVLIGLADQALSFRRDVRDRDYPTKFYEELLMPEERRIGNQGLSDTELLQQQYKAETVLMERTYLTAWQDFSSQSAKMVSVIADMVASKETDVEGQLHALRALSACRYESRDLRNKIMVNIAKSTGKVSAEAVVDAFVGQALCEYQPPNTHKVLNQLLSHVDVKDLSFDQRLDLAHALALLSMPKSPVLKDIITQIDALTFERTDNELSYRQFKLLHQTYESLKLQGSTVNFKNKNLLLSLQSFDHMQSRYEEAKNFYDPLKARVVAGLAKGLNSDLDKVHQSQQLTLKQEPHSVVRPDILTGVDGKKTALYVLNQSEFMKDTLAADGCTAHFIKLNSRFGAVKNVVVPLDSVVTYDLKNFQLKLRDDFNLTSLIGKEKTTAVVKFSKFAQELAQSSHQAVTLGLTDSNMDNFLAQMVSFFAKKDRSDHLHEPEQVAAANDELKFQLLKLQLIHDTKLSAVQKMHIKNCCMSQQFSELIEEVKNTINQRTPQQEPTKFAKMFDFSWLGTRQSVELPTLANQGNGRKQIACELISQKFLQHSDYHQYEDWKAKMQETYDQFNLMQLPEPQNKVTINFDANNHKRKVAKGIFPHPNKKRVVLKRPQNLLGKVEPLHDRFTQFESSPMQYMLEKEFSHSETLKPISDEVGMICNLQNIKHGLKSDFSDEEILKTLLLNCSFTDLLIQEHLGTLAKTGQPKFLERDPEAFRRHATKEVKTQSPYNQFYLKEALKQGNISELFATIQDLKHKDGAQDEIAAAVKEIENILMKNETENEDMFNLSKGLDNFVDVKFDLKSLGVLDARPNGYSSQTAQEFLDQERCRAESTLIKSKIIYKLHSDLKLSDQEKLYLKSWQAAMGKNQCLIDECLVPSSPSSLSLQDLDADNFYTLESIPNVSLPRKTYGKFALNDLCVEIASVFDRDVVRNVELSCLEASLKKEWTLQQDFKLVETRNKEIDLVLQELEETAWRMAGQFSQGEADSIKAMVSVGRGEDHFDRQFVKQDMESLDQFLSQVNDYDNRIELLEAWLCRKEQEIKSRVNLPTAELQRPDSEIFAGVEARFKPVREKLVAEMLKTDEFGNGKSLKAYKHLNFNDLHHLTEALCVRLHLFNRNYPAFLPQVVRAVIEHENLNNIDRSTLDTYCKMFELDWRGDQTIQNRDEFLATHPIYLHTRDGQSLSKSINNDSVRILLQKACQPYLPQLTAKLMKKVE